MGAHELLVHTLLRPSGRWPLVNVGFSGMKFRLIRYPPRGRLVLL